MSFRDPYVQPGTFVLKNNYGFLDQRSLDTAERELVRLRLRQGVPEGDFSLSHLRQIHRHLFQDLYSWAGELRTVDMWKGETHFQHPRYIETGMADVVTRLEKQDFLRGLTAEEFAIGAGQIISDVNHAHPFREGNGRVQLQYLSQLSEQAGHPIDLALIKHDPWIAACREAQDGPANLLSFEIGRAAGVQMPTPGPQPKPAEPYPEPLRAQSIEPEP